MKNLFGYILAGLLFASVVYADSWSELDALAGGSIVDGDYLLTYDISLPAPTKTTVANFVTSIDYTNIGGYVAGGHVDWTIDQGGTNIYGPNIGDIAASILSENTIRTPRGGLRADVSALDGLLGLEMVGLYLVGVDVSTKSELEAKIADVDNFTEADGEVYSGTHDFTGATFTSGKQTLQYVTEDVWCNHVAPYDCSFGDYLKTLPFYFTLATVFKVRTGGGAWESTFSMQDGTAGDVKIIYLMVDGGDLKIQPNNFANGSYITLDTVGESVILEFDGTSWFIAANNGGSVT